MTAHQRELFTPRAPERRGLRDWLYLELHTSGSMSVEELRLRAVMAGYRDDEDGTAFNKALEGLVLAYLVRFRRDQRQVLEVCP